MKTIYQVAAMALFIVTITSCQKVIDVSLNNAEQKYVIEGSVTDGPGPYTVTLSRTKAFTENNTFERISGAQVTITDVTAGNTDTLHDGGTGNYQTGTLAGVRGHAYLLSVVINGQTFTAASTMPAVAVAVDTLYASRPDFGDPNSAFMTPVFTDPVGTGNYYRLRQWVNGIEVKGSRVRGDEVSDGHTYSSQLYYDADDDSGNPKIGQGDSISVELQCINKQVYDYYRTLTDVTGENSATPANPLTNVTGGALGIFNTCTSRRKSAIAAY